MIDHVTSDTHWWHTNILGFPSCDKFRKNLYGPKEDRESLYAMNAGMIEIWNKHVKADDVVAHLGDFVIAYGRYMEPRVRDILEKINGKIILVGGNHDNRDTKRIFREFGHEVVDYKRLDLPDKRTIIMSHYPMLVWDKCHHGSVMLHGHSHGSLVGAKGKILDVGWDVWGRPLTLEEAYRYADKKEKHSADGH